MFKITRPKATFVRMNIAERIEVLSALGQSIKSDIKANRIDALLDLANQQNPWFVPEFSLSAMQAVAEHFLDAAKLKAWLAKYKLAQSFTDKNVGLVQAGNIPLVGFHDLLSIFISGHRAHYKPSSKDEVLQEYVLNELFAIEPKLSERFKNSQQLKEIDAVIATGSNNTNRYFEAYFKKYPSILRKNRTSVAMLDGSESEDELSALADDIFQYFGLGCRNVSKVLIPEDFEIERLLKSFEKYSWLGNHSKWDNNYTYQKSVYLVNKLSHFDTGFVLMAENSDLFAPLGMLYCQRYNDFNEVQAYLESRRGDLQVVVSKGEMDFKTVPMGQSQRPTLTDYADNIDTLEFLKNL